MTAADKAKYKREYMKKYHALHKKQRCEAQARYKEKNIDKIRKNNARYARKRREKLKNEAK